MSELHKEYRVAIVGGGMGGLALAVGLTGGGIKVDIFEQAPRFDEIGAGVGIGANGIRALRGLGILEAVLERAEEPLGLRGFQFISGLPGHEDIFDVCFSQRYDLVALTLMKWFWYSIMP